METTEETNLPLNGAEPTGLLLLQDAQYYLHQSGKWANFLSIMGFIGAGICVLAGIIFAVAFSALSGFGNMPFPGALGAIFGILYIGIGGIAFYYSLKLYRFGDGIKKGIEFQNALVVSVALGNLKDFFKMKGIIVIVVLVLYVIIVIAAIIASSMLPHYGNTTLG